MEIDTSDDADITNKSTWGSSPTKMTSVNFNAFLWQSAKEYNISLRDALEFGIQFLIAQKEDFGYPENKLSVKIERLVKTLDAKSRECDALRDQTEKGIPVDSLEEEEKKTKEDIERVFGGTQNGIKN